MNSYEEPSQNQHYHLLDVAIISGSVDAKPELQQQEQQHSRRTAKSFNEVKSDGIIKTCINNDDIKVTFQVQLAHGSPTGIISGFNNIIQLYQVL